MKDLLRKYGLRLLSKTARDIHIRHHWVPNLKTKLNSYRHKGFWYHGKRRERNTMELFARCISPGSVVVEVGGHIGYITAYLSFLAGKSGRVIVFEPGSNNLPYIRENVSGLANVELIEKGVGSKREYLTFHEDNLTGQNNSFVPDFEGLKNNAKAAYADVEVAKHSIEVIPLDDFVESTSPALIKIDVEGFEYSVLLGAQQIMRSFPVVMVEVQADEASIMEFFKERDYLLFNDSGVQAHTPDELAGNVFCFHERKHKTLLDELGFLTNNRTN